MVPFPSPEHSFDGVARYKRLKKGWANIYLREHPDGNGLLLPRMKEEIRKDEAWRTILGPTHDAVQVVGKGGWKDAVAHGLAEYWAKVAFAAGGVDPKHAYLSGARSITPKMHDKKRYETLEHHLFEEENISDNMDYIYDSARRWGIPPETAKKLAAAYPDFLRAAIALSNVAERAYEYRYGKEAHKKFLQGILKPAEIDALIEIMESKISLRRITWSRSLHVQKSLKRYTRCTRGSWICSRTSLRRRKHPLKSSYQRNGERNWTRLLS